jgi:hypothetical protein
MSEFSVEPVNKIHAMLLVEMNDDFGVRMGAKRCPCSINSLTQLFVVVDLPIEIDADRAVFVIDGWSPSWRSMMLRRTWPKASAPAVKQGIARAIRPAVADHGTHPRDVFALGGTAILS